MSLYTSGEASCQHIAQHHPDRPHHAQPPTWISPRRDTLPHRSPDPTPERPDNQPCPRAAPTRCKPLVPARTPNTSSTANTPRRRKRPAHHTGQRLAHPPPPRTTPPPHCRPPNCYNEPPKATRRRGRTSCAPTAAWSSPKSAGFDSKTPTPTT